MLMTGITGNITPVLGVVCVVERLDNLSFSPRCFVLTVSWMLAKVCIGLVSMEVEIEVFVEGVEYNDVCGDDVKRCVAVEGV